MALKAKINNQQDLRIRSSLTSREISKLDDVDMTGLDDGSVLVYSTASSKWEATNLLEKQTVECGQY
jgi:hypothetical protein